MITCKELYLWFLATDLLATPPREVRVHIDDCPRCRQRHQRLLNLNAVVHDLPVSPASPDARARLLRSLDAAPGPRPAFWPRFRWQVLAGVAAALLLAVVGVAAVVNGLNPERIETEDAPQTRKAEPEPDVVGSVLDRHLKLAKGLTPAERYQELMGVATDLRGEALRLAKAPASAELGAVVKLYQRVVREGRLLERAEALPLMDQTHLITPLLRKLWEDEKAAEKLLGTAPADVAAPLRELTATTRELRGRLSKMVGEKPL
jgi:hypothetical protein